MILTTTHEPHDLYGLPDYYVTDLRDGLLAFHYCLWMTLAPPAMNWTS
jgi:hypothetical protein